MGLILTLREGESFWLNEREVVVEQVFDNRNALLYDPKTGDRFEVTDERASDLGDNVMAHVAVQPATVVLSLDASQDIKILRDGLKRRERRYRR